MLILGLFRAVTIAEALVQNDYPEYTRHSAIKTHYYIIFLSYHYILSNGELLLIEYRPIIMVGLWCYNQSGVTELLIMRDPHYGQMCFKSVKTLGTLLS